METIKSSQILVRVALICAMATASKPSTRLSASDEPPQKKPKTDQHKRPIATPLASRDGFIQYNDLKDEIIQARKRRLERGEPELTVAEFLEKYSGEPRVIPLDQILTSMFNRNEAQRFPSEAPHDNVRNDLEEWWRGLLTLSLQSRASARNRTEPPQFICKAQQRHGSER